MGKTSSLMILPSYRSLYQLTVAIIYHRESGQTLVSATSGHLKNFSRVFLAVSVFALVIEIVAHFKKWNLNLINPWEVQGLVQWSYMAWLSFRCKKLKPVIEGEPYDIEDCSGLDWPKNRFLVQVLDDSDVESLQNLIRNEGTKQAIFNQPWADYVKDYEFVAIFDSDFQPNPDFLKLTIPHFKGNPEVGLVQAHWSFVNKGENLIARLQNVNLCFHFEVERQFNGMFINFFGFNGTAGVWRIKALEESGGWFERTTVEDMDIAVRAHLNGWKFIFLNDVRVLCELPESYEAYKKQQHCWHSGPMQLFRLCLPAILTFKIPMWKKANMIFLFFLLRKLILPFYSFTLFCVILPLAMFIPEAELPLWVVCYVPVFMSFLNVLPSPKSFPFLIPYLLFENTMSGTKFNAMVSGLFQLGSGYSVINSGVMKDCEMPFFARHILSSL
ncbi:unnamed protein product [Camellia sinensis]